MNVTSISLAPLWLPVRDGEGRDIESLVTEIERSMARELAAIQNKGDSWRAPRFNALGASRDALVATHQHERARQMAQIALWQVCRWIAEQPELESLLDRRRHELIEGVKNPSLGALTMTRWRLEELGERGLATILTTDAVSDLAKRLDAEPDDTSRAQAQQGEAIAYLMRQQGMAKFASLKDRADRSFRQGFLALAIDGRMDDLESAVLQVLDNGPLGEILPDLPVVNDLVKVYNMSYGHGRSVAGRLQ